MNGIAIACVGDKATCPTHKVVATIVSGDPHMNIFGKMAARASDSLSLGANCYQNKVWSFRIMAVEVHLLQLNPH
ncbi:PAAR domain-containing protein [Acinetobacter baumannii]|nr:PAAR domain-containing protein [Acinetobacter baumannii]